MDTQAWHLRAVELPFGDTPTDWWIDGGRVTRTAVVGATTLPGAYVVPGLVDAHAHLTMDMSATGLERGSAALVAANADLQLRAGVTVVRDTGTVPGAVLPDETRGLTVIGSGGMLAPRGRYHDSLTTPAELDEVVQMVSEAVATGTRWVKIIADFPGPDWNWFAAPPTYPIEIVREIVAAAHDGGARVAAHVSSGFVADLVRAGIDSIEHGPSITRDLVDEMAERGTAWVPTLSTVVAKHLDALTQGDTPIGHHLRGVYAEMERALARAVERGVPIMAGTDEHDHGSIAFEISQLRRFGLSGSDALAAASTWARTFLGLAGLDEGAPADLVLYDADPRLLPEALRRPVAMFARGEMVAVGSAPVSVPA